MRLKTVFLKIDRRSPLPHTQIQQTDSESGFSLIEVLVTILVISGFLLGALQATVLATLLRVQAQDKQDALNWVQQDLELVRYQAFILDNPEFPNYDPPTPDPSPANDTGNTGACATSTYGTRLQDFIDGTYANTANVTINKKDYSVARTYTPSGNPLQITYTVSYASTHPRYNSKTIKPEDNIVTTLSTEELPNAALSCP